MSTSNAGRKLELLELGRGVAACAVVVHHASLASDAFTGQDHSSLFDAGALGVDFFFVLSGFIIYHTHRNDPRSWAAAREFMIKRFRRIYIPYLPISVALMAAYTLLPGLSQGDRDWSVLTSLTLLPTASPPALSVAWTLVFEMTFYACFLSFYATRHFWALVCLWTGMTLAVALFSLESSVAHPVLKVLLDPLILDFCAGMLMARMLSEVAPRSWWVASAAGFFAMLVFFLHPGLHRVLFGIAASLAVLGLAQAELHMKPRLPRIFLLLGAASYAIYLVHNPLQSLIARVAASQQSWLIVFIACCVVGVVAGIAYHLAYERPLLYFFSRPLRRTANVL